MLRTSIDKMKDNSFKLTKEGSRRYPVQTIMDANYVDDIVLLANTPAQAETLLHSLEQAAADIDLHVNANKTEYMGFNQRGNISMLYGSVLKLVDKFTYIGSSVSSTKTDINLRLAKAWTAIDRLSVIWKSDLTDNIYIYVYIHTHTHTWLTQIYNRNIIYVHICIHTCPHMVKTHKHKYDIYIYIYIYIYSTELLWRVLIASWITWWIATF